MPRSSAPARQQAPPPPGDLALPSDQAAAQGAQRQITIREALSSPAQLAEFKRALPAHVGVDRFVRVALTTINTTPKLQRCTKDSILAGLMQAAQLGLEVSGVRGQAFLVPRKDGRASRQQSRDVFEATFQLGYRGMIDLAARSGITVDVDVVHANDDFDWERGTNARLFHRPTLGEPGPVIAYYAVANFADARRPQFVLRSVMQIEQHRDKFASSRDYDTKEITGPWVEHFDAMALKTVIRQLLDKLPTTIELRQAVVVDEEREQATHTGPLVVGDPMGAIDVTTTDAPAGVDQVTGEIVSGSGPLPEAPETGNGDIGGGDSTADVASDDDGFDANDPNDPTTPSEPALPIEAEAR